MFKINYINVTLWILGSILLLFLFGAIIYRFKKNDKAPSPNKMVVSKEIKDLSISLKSIYEIPSLVNILFKNKFSKKQFSLIPLLAAHKNNIYLVTNFYKIKKTEMIHLESNKIISKNSKKEFDLNAYKDIQRYLKSINIKSKLIIPTNIDIEHNTLLTIINVNNVGSFITSDMDEMNNDDIYKNFKKIQSKNIYKSKSIKEDF